MACGCVASVFLIFSPFSAPGGQREIDDKLTIHGDCVIEGQTRLGGSATPGQVFTASDDKGTGGWQTLQLLPPGGGYGQYLDGTRQWLPLSDRVGAPLTYDTALQRIGWGGTTSQVPEGTNQYFTAARARASLSAAPPLAYNGATGIFSLPLNTALTWTGLNTFSGGALINNGGGVSDNGLQVQVHFDANTPLGVQNWVDGLTPTLAGAPAAAAAVVDSAGRVSLGNCLAFDGVDDYLSFDSARYELGGDGNGSFTLCVWLRAGAADAGYLATNYSTATSKGFRWALTNDGGQYLVVYDGSNVVGPSTQYPPVSWFDGKWHLWSFTLERATKQMVWYCDAVPFWSATYSALGNAAGNSAYRLACDANGSQRLAAQLDEWLQFSRALSAGEIRALYNAGEFVNRSALQQVYLQAYRSGNTAALASAATTVVPFNVETVDTAQAFNPATGVFTVPMAGTYYVAACCYFEPNASGSRACGIAVAGTIVMNGVYAPNSSNATSAAAGGVLRLAAGQTVDVRAWQNSGTALAINGSAPYVTYLTIARVGL
jgi:hypothetical protein